MILVASVVPREPAIDQQMKGPDDE